MTDREARHHAACAATAGLMDYLNPFLTGEKDPDALGSFKEAIKTAADAVVEVTGPFDLPPALRHALVCLVAWDDLLNNDQPPDRKVLGTTPPLLRNELRAAATDARKLLSE